MPETPAAALGRRRWSLIPMTYSAIKNNARNWLAAAVIAGLFLPVAATAQVVVVANGSPITALAIAQRTKLVATSPRKAPSRQEVVQELIDDRLKLAKPTVNGMEDRDAEETHAI